jgi:hypothetical protein
MKGLYVFHHEFVGNLDFGVLDGFFSLLHMVLIMVVI